MIEKIATIEDVAEHAGVSIATVSRALHKPHVVSESTREKVQTAIAEPAKNPLIVPTELIIRQSTGPCPT